MGPPKRKALRGSLAKVLAGVAALTLAGCATRQVTPVRMSQPGDASLSCAELAGQIAANRASAEKLLKQDKKVAEGNTAKSVGGALPMVGVFLLASNDFSNAEQIQARALIDRDEQLRFLKKQKGCPS
jgi:hypothetical protein